MEESFDNIKISQSHIKDNNRREQSYLLESQIRENYLKNNCNYDNTMNHSIKIRDTKKIVHPASDIYESKEIFKTTLNSLCASDVSDPYRTIHFNKKADLLTKFNEDMLKAQNMVNKKKDFK
jgi:hypothetical protein